MGTDILKIKVKLTRKVRYRSKWCKKKHRKPRASKLKLSKSDKEQLNNFLKQQEIERRKDKDFIYHSNTVTRIDGKQYKL